MKKDITDILASLQDIRLSETERARIRNMLEGYTVMRPANHATRSSPLSEELSGSSAWKSIGQRLTDFTRLTSPVTFGAPTRLNIRAGYPLPLFSRLLIIPNRMTAIATVLMVALLGGGGTAIAAEGAIPGDLLYSVKVEVNENIRGFLAVSDKAEAELQVTLASRRADEAAKLAARGKLDEDTRAKLDARTTAHIERAEEHIEHLRAKSDMKSVADIESSLEASLVAYRDALVALRASGEIKGNAEVSLGTIISTLNRHAKSATEARVESNITLRADARITKEAATRMHIATQKFVRMVLGVYEAEKASLSSRVQTAVESDLRAAEEALAEGDAKAEAGAYAEALIKYHEAKRHAQSAHVLIRTTVHADKEAGHRADKAKENESRHQNIEDEDEREVGDNENSNGRNKGNSGNGPGNRENQNASIDTSTSVDTSTDVDVSVGGNDDEGGMNVKIEHRGNGRLDISL